MNAGVILALCLGFFFVVPQAQAADAKKEVKRKPSSTAPISREELAQRASLDVLAIPKGASRYCAMYSTAARLGNATQSIFFSPNYAKELGFTSNNGLGSCWIVDRVFSIHARSEIHSKLIPSTWDDCYKTFRDAVGKEAGDAIEGVPTAASKYKTVSGEFSTDNQSASWDCGDLKN